MFLIRKIGKTLRGQAKPYQILAASILGALIGFAPPLTAAPFYLIAVILLLAVINANLFVATVTAGLCKLLSLALMFLSFELGLILVDGPTQPLFKALINAPVTALMGFDYYITSGGALLAVIIGTAIGLAFIKIVNGFRKKMAAVEATSEKYADYVSKRSVRVLMWVLFGGRAKKSYAELMEQKKIGNPIRIPGVVFAVVVVALLYVGQSFVAGPYLTRMLRTQLENFNGATVDLEGVKLDLANGQLTIGRLAMADPDDLSRDIFRATELTAKISTADLLSKKFTVDQLIVDDAVQGAKRETPGVLIAKKPEPPKPEEGEKSVYDWFEKAKEWKGRIETYYDWYKKLKGPPDEEKEKKEKEETIEDRLRRFAERYGHGEVRAEHLVEGSPTALIRLIEVRTLRATWPENETLTLTATNISTHPALVPDKPRIVVTSSGNTFDLDLAIAPAAVADGKSELKLNFRNQSVEKTLGNPNLYDIVQLQGGTWQVAIDGFWEPEDMDLPVTFQVQNTDLMIPKLKKTVKDQTLPVKFTVGGSLDAPTADLDTKALTTTTLAIAKKELGNAAVDAILGELGGDLGGIGDRIKDGLGTDPGGLIDGVLGGNRDKDKDKKDDENKDDQDQPATPEDRIRQGIGDLLNR